MDGGALWVRSMIRMAMPPRIKLTDTTQGLNSLSLMKSWAMTPTTAAGRKASATLSVSRCARPGRGKPSSGAPQQHAVDPHHRQDGAQLDDDLEQFSRRTFKTQQVFHQDQVAGGGNGQEFGDALDHPEKGGLPANYANPSEKQRRALSRACLLQIGRRIRAEMLARPRAARSQKPPRMSYRAGFRSDDLTGSRSLKSPSRRRPARM